MGGVWAAEKSHSRLAEGAHNCSIVLGIVGSIVGGLVTHVFSRPKAGERFHPAGIIVSILGALLVLFLWHKYKLHISAG